MSHLPKEHTLLARIVERQDEKIEGLTIILNNLLSIFHHHNILSNDDMMKFKYQLHEVQKM